VLKEPKKGTKTKLKNREKGRSNKILRWWVLD